MSAQHIRNSVGAGQSCDEMLDAAIEVVDAVAVAAVNCIDRSAVVSRLSTGSLPFAGRIAWLEQHWEGLRILRDCAAVPAVVRRDMITATHSLSATLDRAHAGARWRDRHVTMPSMLAFRRHVAGLRDSDDVIGLTAQSYIRLLCAGIGVGTANAESLSRHNGELRCLLCSLVKDEEDLERLSEELSAGLLIFMQHGSDVCRAYQEALPDESCAVTAATIRSSLR